MNDPSMTSTPHVSSLISRIADLEAREAHLRAEFEHLRQLFAQAPFAYQSLDEQGCFIDVNQTWLDTLGYGREEVIGRHFSAFLSPHGQADFTDNFQKFKDEGEIQGIELEMMRKDGTPILVAFNGKIGTTREGAFKQTHCFFQDITRRRQDETALRESEERFRALHSASFGGIVIHDRGVILDCNQGLAEQTGYTLDELIGMDGLDLIAPEWRDKVRRSIAQGDESPYEAAGLRKDGSIYPISLRGTNIPYKGRMVRVAEFRDITEYKRLEEVLEKRLVALTCPLTESEAISFEDLFDRVLIQRIQDEFAQATGVASIITHPDGTPITAPSNFTRLCSAIIRSTGKGCVNCFKSDAIIGRYHPSGPIVQPCLSGGLWDAGASITVGGRHLANWLIGQVRNETQNEASMRQYARDIGADEAAFMEAFGEVPSMSREQFGRVAQALFTLANQLSNSAYQNMQQARAITERRQAEEALRVSEERFRLAMEATKDGLWDWDIPTGAVYYSPSCWSMLGYDANPGLQSADAWMAMIHPEDRDAVLAANADCLENRCETFLVEYRMRSASGDWRWIQGRGKAVTRGADGRALRMIGTLIDMTERKHTEDEREKLKAQLLQSQKMESVARLAGGIAHDFNNMLTVIQGHTEMALMHLPPEDPCVTRFSAIRDIVQRSTELTRQLLAFARKQPIAPRALNLNATVESLLAMLKRLIGENINLVWTPGLDLWQVKADPSQIDQILVNLCVNARDAIDGIGKVMVEISNCTLAADYCASPPGVPPGAYVRLSVSDNGCGMEKAIIAQIFEPFFTTKGMGKGSGLGLATVYGAVKQNGGFIDVCSEPGQGSRFSVYLPRYDGADLQDRAEEEVRAGAGGCETILVVEDEAAILETTTIMLQHLGYAVLTAANPVEALNLVKEQGGRVDLLLTDVIMPKMNGRDLANRLLVLQPWIRCLFMSGYSEDFIAHQGVLKEGIHFIQKPFSLPALAAKVRQALQDGEGAPKPA